MDHRFLSWVSSLPARIGLGLTAMGAIAVSIPVSDLAVFSPEKSLGLATAIGLWLWAEIKSHPLSPHPHDIQLFQRAAALIDPDLDWLRDQDFGNSFSAQRGKGLHDIADLWRGAAHQFRDPKLAKAWALTREAIDDFTHNLVAECGPTPGNVNRLTVKTVQDFQQGGRSERTLVAAQKLNDGSTKVVRHWDNTVSIAVARLGVPARAA